MKKIIFIRPGKHNKGGSLTGEGQRNLVDLTQKLRESEINQEARISIFSSPVIHALETTNLLCRELNIKTECIKEHEVLGVKIPKNSIFYNKQVSEIVEREVEEETDVLIMVTNKSVIKSFPRYYSITSLWGDCSYISLRRGEAFILNFDKAETTVFHQPMNIFV